MNETELVLYSILAYFNGYGIAWFFTNMGRLFTSWGLLGSYFLFPMIYVVLLFLAASIADLQNFIISTVFAIGFIVGMVKNYGH
ncbi:MAG: hypothetical protein HQL46_02530 [Gammaproteobacteria bacterium]|nr:hypothetical protein [Gammaproteobacteria bacterium]